MNISSIIIKADSSAWESLLQEISQIPHVEIALHQKDRGIMIATIEAENTQQELEALKKIQILKGVFSAEMHLTYSEGDLKNYKLDMQKIAKFIDTTPAELMKYGGDIKNFIK
ncbi:periplasmic nitrate reductase subunit NapD [Helicobacter mustelae]|uniref:chaperone NapD n=1 Tax=Helicobacter mustelae TaxID=217 RepID=UPI000DFBE3C9|nr:chaperone NapD [Helicobacter mustelae]STP13008.1 periplasmic nitrate reductase subunit NapD [Helicobacter mustelae]